MLYLRESTCVVLNPPCQVEPIYTIGLEVRQGLVIYTIELICFDWSLTTIGEDTIFIPPEADDALANEPLECRV